MRTVDFAFFSQIAYFDWYKINEYGEFYDPIDLKNDILKNERQVKNLKYEIEAKRNELKNLNEEIKELEGLKSKLYDDKKNLKLTAEEYMRKQEAMSDKMVVYEKKRIKKLSMAKNLKNFIQGLDMVRVETQKEVDRLKRTSEFGILELIEEKSDILGVKKDEEIVDGIKLYGFEDKRLYAVYSEDSVNQKPKFSFEGWKFCKGYNNHKSDLQIALFRKNDNYMIAIRGTEQSSKKDLFTDVQLAVNKFPRQAKNIIFWYEENKEKLKEAKNIFITGHSLGGWLSQLLYLYTEKKYKTVTFNGFGVDKNQLKCMNNGLDEVVLKIKSATDIVRLITYMNRILSFKSLFSNEILEKIIKEYDSKGGKECINYVNEYDLVGNANLHVGKEYGVLYRKENSEINLEKRVQEMSISRPFFYHGVNDFIQFMDDSGNIPVEGDINQTFKENYIKTLYKFLKAKNIFLKKIEEKVCIEKIKIDKKSEEGYYICEISDSDKFQEIVKFTETMYINDISKVNKNFAKILEKEIDGEGQYYNPKKINFDPLSNSQIEKAKRDYKINYERIYKDKIYKIEMKEIKNDKISKKLNCDYIGAYKIGKFNNLKSVDITRDECEKNYIFGGFPYLVFIRKKEENNKKNINTTYVLDNQKLRCNIGSEIAMIKVKSQSTKSINKRLVATIGDTEIKGNFGYCYKSKGECTFLKCKWQNYSPIKGMNGYNLLNSESYCICENFKEKIEIISEKIKLKTK